MATGRKVRSGVSFDEELISVLDKHAENLESLGVDRSEVVNAILTEYFEGGGSVEAVWDVVSKRRARHRK